MVMLCSTIGPCTCTKIISCLLFNTLRPRQNGRHFADDIFKCIFLNENIWISNKISLKFVPKGPINNIPALVQIMAWRCLGDKPLSEPMMVSLPTHISVARPQWVNVEKLIKRVSKCYLNWYTTFWFQCCWACKIEILDSQIFLNIHIIHNPGMLAYTNQLLVAFSVFLGRWPIASHIQSGMLVPLCKYVFQLPTTSQCQATM